MTANQPDPMSAANEAVKSALLAIAQDQGCNPASIKLVTEALQHWEAVESRVAADLREKLTTAEKERDLAKAELLLAKEKTAWDAQEIDRAKTNVRHWRDNCGKLEAQLRIIAELPTGKTAQENLSAAVHRYVKTLTGERDEARTLANKLAKDLADCAASNANEIQGLRNQLKEAKRLNGELLAERADVLNEAQFGSVTQTREALAALEAIGKRSIRITFDQIEDKPGVFNVTFPSGQVVTFERIKSFTEGSVHNWLANLRHAKRA